MNVSRPFVPVKVKPLPPVCHEIPPNRSQSETCENCGSNRIYSGPPDCPGCGAPNCCQICCKISNLEKQIERLKSDNLCDICLGKPLESGQPCGCGGTGKMSDVAIYLRTQFFSLLNETGHRIISGNPRVVEAKRKE